jgi:hypothetical protein
MKVYLLTARTVGSANFAYIGFCELRLYGVIGSSHVRSSQRVPHRKKPETARPTSGSGAKDPPPCGS